MILIPQLTWERLRAKIDAGEQVPSLEIVDEGGKYMASFIVAPVSGGMTIFDEIRTKAEYLGVAANSVLAPKIVENVGLWPSAGLPAAGRFGPQAGGPEVEPVVEVEPARQRSAKRKRRARRAVSV